MCARTRGSSAPCYAPAARCARNTTSKRARWRFSITSASAAARMNPAERQALAKLIGRIRDEGITILLIEHDVRLVMNVCDRVMVLDYGHKIAEGPPAEVQRDP